ncbi:hypothetical protein [Blastococcus sp. PRF04-17]|uniref:hypothetical protein n=1 Tax=Blastococcus sp. PRF04-17 TaxID=2933797 RepID=UPI001FF47C13|nr:hypothetical protein [Blastococcus sp. PRF04-17]UOY02458.1 hypothetical protein MVA48_03455 [Blastococcus sp. PRF04-17]
MDDFEADHDDVARRNASKLLEAFGEARAQLLQRGGIRLERQDGASWQGVCVWGPDVDVSTEMQDGGLASATCHVLRCTEPAVTVWTESAWRRPIQVPVCQQHLCALESGERRQLTQDHLLLMHPDDLSPSHEWLVVTQRPNVTRRRSDEVSTDPTHMLHLVADVRRRGGAELEELDLVMTQEFARNLHEVLAHALRQNHAADGW